MAVDHIGVSPWRDLWRNQHFFTADVLNSTRGLTLGNMTPEERSSITEKYLLSIHKETSELLDNVNWKEHRREIHPMLRRNLLEEMIDVQKFLWGLAQIWDVDELEYRQAFDEKNFVVGERFRMEHQRLTNPLMVVDIDGVLYKHDDMFRKWMRDNRPNLARAAKRDNALAWEEARHAFRESQEKRYGQAYEDNVRHLQRFKDLGWSVVLMTYRPVKVFKNLEYDTLYWLRQNEVPVDRIIWAAYEKYFYMREELDQAEVFIDDELETCQMVAQLDKRVYWVCPGSTPRTRVEGVRQVTDLSVVWEWEEQERETAQRQLPKVI